MEWWAPLKSWSMRWTEVKSRTVGRHLEISAFNNPESNHLLRLIWYLRLDASRDGVEISPIRPACTPVGWVSLEHGTWVRLMWVAFMPRIIQRLLKTYVMLTFWFDAPCVHLPVSDASIDLWQSGASAMICVGWRAHKLCQVLKAWSLGPDLDLPWMLQPRVINEYPELKERQRVHAHNDIVIHVFTFSGRRIGNIAVGMGIRKFLLFPNSGHFPLEK